MCFMPDMRKVVVGSSSTFLSILMVPQNKHDFSQKIYAILPFPPYQKSFVTALASCSHRKSKTTLAQTGFEFGTASDMEKHPSSLAALAENFRGFGGNIFKLLPLFCDAFGGK